jgi:uracil-DNA glycosylase
MKQKYSRKIYKCRDVVVVETEMTIRPVVLVVVGKEAISNLLPPHPSLRKSPPLAETTEEHLAGRWEE